MPRYKVLRSVAHNIGHSFTSLMNYADDDYVMGHILRFARQSGRDTLTIDFVAGTGTPRQLLRKPLSEVPARYTKFFWDLVHRHGSERSYVARASLTVRFDLSQERPARDAPQFLESPYTCHVRVTDKRGKEYVAEFKDWWFPERLEQAALPYVWNWLREQFQRNRVQKG